MTEAVVRTQAEVDADILKAQAEARKAEAEARKAEAEARKAEAEIESSADKIASEIEKSRAETAKVEVEAAAERLKLVKAEHDADREREKRREELAADKYHHRYLFDTGVDEANVTKCVRQLSLWERTANGENITVELVINSPGGSVFDGFALIDYITGMHHRGHTVNTTAYGMAASMGGVLLQIGKTRRMGANALLLIHEAQFGASGTFGKIEDQVKMVEKMQDRILDLFASRASVSRATIKKNWRRRDWWLTAQESLKNGFVDEVL